MIITNGIKIYAEYVTILINILNNDISKDKIDKSILDKINSLNKIVIIPKKKINILLEN